MRDSGTAAVVYHRLPVALQNLACSYYGLMEARVRFSAEFHRRLESLLETEWWTASDIAAYQDQMLSQVVAHAYEHVPHYRDVMKARRLGPADIKSRRDLAKLPVLTKEDVRAGKERLLARGVQRRALVPMHTSGTTGKSLHFYSSRSARAFQWAIWWRHRRRFGLELKDRHANFTGKLVVDPARSRPPYWRWNLPMRQALLTMHHLTPNKVQAVVEFLDSFDFKYYSGYPSVIHALALSAREAGLSLQNPPGVVVTGAENVLAVQRRDIGALTAAIVTDQYGLSEGCGNASHCEAFRYHEDFEFGIVECVDPQPGADGVTTGRVVCTGFANAAFPFIRYETGDVGTWAAAGDKCACGRESTTLVGIEGRVDDYVVTPEGRRIMRFDYIFKDVDAVRESQIIQERPGQIIVRVARRAWYSERDEREIAEEVARWVSPTLEVEFEYVTEIPREANGKFRAVRSLVRLQGDEIT